MPSHTAVDPLCPVSTVHVIAAAPATTASTIPSQRSRAVGAQQRRDHRRDQEPEREQRQHVTELGVAVDRVARRRAARP